MQTSSKIKTHVSMIFDVVNRMAGNELGMRYFDQDLQQIVNVVEDENGKFFSDF
jgi:hypothetical protein